VKARMSLFKPVYIDQRVALSPTEFRAAADDMDGFLVKKLRKQLEGKCNTHGWVRPGSVQILARSMGQAEHGRFTADFLFQCKIKMLCFEPHANMMVDARVLTANKLGAYVLVVDQGRLLEAARILLPRDYHEGNAEFDALKAGQGLHIRILSFRYQTNDAFINAVGMFEGLAPAADAHAAEAEAEVAAALQPAVPPTEGVAEVAAAAAAAAATTA